jgi:hypothetical protein
MEQSRPIKRIDVLRHELKALRFILDNYHSGAIERSEMPTRDDFQAEQTRAIFERIIGAPNRAAAEDEIARLELDEVDIESFLRLTGEHYYTYPALVRERAEAIRRGELKVESA